MSHKFVSCVYLFPAPKQCLMETMIYFPFASARYWLSSSIHYAKVSPPWNARMGGGRKKHKTSGIHNISVECAASFIEGLWTWTFESVPFVSFPIVSVTVLWAPLTPHNSSNSSFAVAGNKNRHSHKSSLDVDAALYAGGMFYTMTTQMEAIIE